MDHPVETRLIIFDADGTLRRCVAHCGPCHSDAGQWEIIPGVREVLQCYNWQTTCVGIATNQAGIALGHRTAEAVMAELKLLCDHLFPGSSVGIYVCPHADEQRCLCRKPSPGLLWFNVMRHDLALHTTALPLQHSSVLFVGDSPEDEQAACTMGIRFLNASEFFGWDAPYNATVKG